MKTIFNDKNSIADQNIEQSLPSKLFRILYLSTKVKLFGSKLDDRLDKRCGRLLLGYTF